LPKQLFFYDIRFGDINIISIMKNLLVIVLSFFVLSTGLAQEKTADFGADSETYQKNRTNGVYVFHLDSKEYTLEQVNKAASYYKDNFTVTPKLVKEKIQVQIVLRGVSTQNKNVITRFFVGLEVDEVSYKNETFKVMDFLGKYI
jgi:hypothetical protein